MRVLALFLSLFILLLADSRGLIKINNTETIPIAPFGKYYALIIANQNYKNLPKLKTPYKDAQDVANLLKNSYGFDTKIVKDITRDELYSYIDSYESLDKNTNLLIYYAGHGYYDKELEEAFWQMIDATESDSSWVSFDRIKKRFKKKLQSKHILIVSDSCYSGGLLRDSTLGKKDTQQSKYFQRLANDSSRNALSSGGLEAVSDGGGYGNSVFAKAFLDTLSAEDKSIFTISSIIEPIKMKTMGNSTQTPKFGTLKDSGDNAGDFIFIKQDSGIKEVNEENIFVNKQTTYKLYISTTPNDAKITINNNSYTYPMELKKDENYNIEIKKDGYISKEGNILLDKDIKIEVSLEKEKIINTTTQDIWQDPTTGLIWQNQPMSINDKVNYDNNKEGSRVWQWKNVKKYCSSLALANKRWRVPSKSELKTLSTNDTHKTQNGDEYYIKESMLKSMPLLNGKYESANFWSSTEAENYTFLAWCIGFGANSGNYINKTNANYVLCVADSD